MKKFGLGDHKFDPNITAHLSRKGSTICKDLTYVTYVGGRLYSMSEDFYDEGMDCGSNGEVESRLNDSITAFTHKRSGRFGEPTVFADSILEDIEELCSN